MSPIERFAPFTKTSAAYPLLIRELYSDLSSSLSLSLSLSLSFDLLFESSNLAHNEADKAKWNAAGLVLSADFVSLRECCE